MPTILYGLTLPDDPRPAGVTGVGGGACRVLDGGSVAAIVGTVSDAPPASVDAIRAHDAVLRAFVNAGATVAAVRFGHSFADDQACAGEVRERSMRVATVLREHAGCVEMRVLLPVDRVPTPAAGETPATSGPGRAYLEALRAQRQVAPHLALRPMLGPAVRAERVDGFEARGSGVRGIAFAHLVRRDDLDAYRDAIRALPSLSDARVVGPLPLYSFAEPEP